MSPPDTVVAPFIVGTIKKCNRVLSKYPEGVREQFLWFGPMRLPGQYGPAAQIDRTTVSPNHFLMQSQNLKLPATGKYLG